MKNLFLIAVLGLILSGCETYSATGTSHVSDNVRVSVGIQSGYYHPYYPHHYYGHYYYYRPYYYGHHYYQPRHYQPRPKHHSPKHHSPKHHSDRNRRHHRK